MLEKRLHLEIRTPEQLIYEGEITSVKAPGELGSFEILAGHIPFLTVLDIGEIRIGESETPQSIATSGGVFECYAPVSPYWRIPLSGRMKLMSNAQKLLVNVHRNFLLHAIQMLIAHEQKRHWLALQID